MLRLILALTLTALALLLALSLRLLHILPPRPPGAPRDPKNQPAHIAIVLGSGGHTTEMLLLLRNFDWGRYRYRTWIFSAGDGFSAELAREFEAGIAEGLAGRGRADGGNGQEEEEGGFRVVEVPRARRVHQSFLSTPWSALRCLWSCVAVLAGWEYGSLGRKARHSRRLYEYPSLIITNGPGTAVMVVLASLILRFLDFGDRGANQRGSMRTLFFESWARVREVSLSGKILVRLVDRFVVQWPALKGYGGRAEYNGWLVIDGGPNAD